MTQAKQRELVDFDWAHFAQGVYNIAGEKSIHWLAIFHLILVIAPFFYKLYKRAKNAYVNFQSAISKF